jgi:hypothetical protein
MPTTLSLIRRDYNAVVRASLLSAAQSESIICTGASDTNVPLSHFFDFYRKKRKAATTYCYQNA